MEPTRPGPEDKSRVGNMRMTGLLIAGALAGKILGFLREIAFARLLGATVVADGFRSALTATLLPIAPLQGDAVPAVLIPLHKRWSAEGRAPERFTSLTLALVCFSVGILVIVELFADSWMRMIATGFGPEAHEIARQFLQVMALGIPASTLLSCLSSVELSLGRSRITSLRASIYNFGVMVGIIITSKSGNPIAIAWCFTAAFNVTALWGTWTLVREGALDLRSVRPAIAFSAVRQFLQQMRSMLVQPFAEQGNVWLERLLGSASGVGVVASLDYARTLTETALFLISQPIGYVVLGRGHQGAEQMRRYIEAIARPLCAVTAPASVFLFLFAPDIVRLVFAHGVFDEHAVGLTGNAVRGIAVGLWAATLGWILIRSLNAAGRNRIAAWILAAAYATNALFNLILVPIIGSLGLGLGEAVRGLVLLAGAAIALRCGGLLVRIILPVLPGCAVLGIAGTLVLAHLDQTLARLGYGMLLYLMVTIPTVIFVSPDAANHLIGRIFFKRPRYMPRPNE